MFNFMRKDRTEEERAERDRRKTEKREKKKSSKREKPLSPEELERLEEVSRSLKMKGAGRRTSEDVVGLRYSQFYLQSEPGQTSGLTSPDSQSDTASTWSSSTASLGRPRGILKSKAPGSVSSSKVDLDDEGLLMKNTQQNEMNIYKLSPGFALQTNQNYNPTSWGEAQHGQQLGFKSRKLLSNFALRLPVIITVPTTDAWVKCRLPLESKVTVE